MNNKEKAEDPSLGGFGWAATERSNTSVCRFLTSRGMSACSAWHVQPCRLTASAICYNGILSAQRTAHHVLNAPVLCPRRACMRAPTPTHDGHAQAHAPPCTQTGQQLWMRKSRPSRAEPKPPMPTRLMRPALSLGCPPHLGGVLPAAAAAVAAARWGCADAEERRPLRPPPPPPRWRCAPRAQ